MRRNDYFPCEEFELVKEISDEELENKTNRIIIDEIGSVFTVKSRYGIREICIYATDDFDFRNRKLLIKYGKLEINEKLYIKADISEIGHIYSVEIIRYNFSKIIFHMSCNGKNGEINLKYFETIHNFKSIIYNLCE